MSQSTDKSMGKSCVFIAFRNSYWLFSCNFDPLIIQVLLMNLDKKTVKKIVKICLCLQFSFSLFSIFHDFFTRKNLHNKWTKIINKLSRIFHLLCQFFNGFSDLNLQIEGVKIHDNSVPKEAIFMGMASFIPRCVATTFVNFCEMVSHETFSPHFWKFSGRRDARQECDTLVDSN